MEHYKRQQTKKNQSRKTGKARKQKMLERSIHSFETFTHQPVQKIEQLPEEWFHLMGSEYGSEPELDSEDYEFDEEPLNLTLPERRPVKDILKEEDKTQACERQTVPHPRGFRSFKTRGAGKKRGQKTEKHRQRALLKKERTKNRKEGRTEKFNQSNSVPESTIEMVVREEPEFWGDELLGCRIWLEEQESYLPGTKKHQTSQRQERELFSKSLQLRLELQKMLLEYDELSERVVRHLAKIREFERHVHNMRI